MLLASKSGRVMTITEWEKHLEEFWVVFETADYKTKKVLPKRPPDAWQRYVKIMGLEPI